MTPPGVLPAQAGIHPPRYVAVLGAPGTGRTQLAAGLAGFLAAHGLRDMVVSEDASNQAGVVLLAGLDLIPANETATAEDARIRAQLQAAGVPYQVVYGTGPDRLRSALGALVAAGVLPAALVPRNEKGGASRAWIASCEKCSDPDCEHRLFTRLRQER